MREPFRRGARRQDQVDLDRHGGRCRKHGRLRVREERLGHRRKCGALDPLQLFSGGIEHRDARQRHRLGEHAHDEKVVFDMVHAVIAADNLRLVNRTDDDRTRPLGLRSRSARRKGEDGGDHETEAHS